MFSILFHHKKLSYIVDNKCFPPYYIDNWDFYFEQCVDASPFTIKFNL